MVNYIFRHANKRKLLREGLLICVDQISDILEVIHMMQALGLLCRECKVTVSAVAAGPTIRFQGQAINNLRRNKALLTFQKSA
jgi:hypothetical protein